MEKIDFRKLSAGETFDKLRSSAAGLSSNEAKARIAKYGYNEILEKKKNKLLKFLLYFWGPLSWLIEVAALLSAILQHWDDLAIILALLAANAIIGFWQENKADDAVAMLKKRLAVTAKVLRDGNWTTLPARELVPGDAVRVRLGDIVPADIKLVGGDYLMLDEAALTGESLPTEKHAGDTTFSGAIVKQGEMDAVVTATGQNTYFGETAKLVRDAKTVSHLQRAIVKIADYLIVLAMVLVAIVLVSAMLRGQDFLNSVQFALILLVASIPVALPTVLSVTMAVGAVALADKEALVTRLESIEELAGVDILCVDKTGTITKNEISIAEVKPFADYSAEDVVSLASLASRKEDNDPIEAAIFSKIGLDDAMELSKRYRVVKYKPFDPVSKRTEAVCLERSTGNSMAVTKGAPQVILALVNEGGGNAGVVNSAVETFATKGYRTLAVAIDKDASGMALVGLIALYDPPRDDSKDTISAAEKMGVDVKMVTGDHVAIARQMCSEVGIGTGVMLASGLKDPATAVSIEKANAFAEVFPEDKYAIVESLQGLGHIVGMTGDGVNDAPALKKAEAGIAVSGATDAARSAADIVLTAPGISVIIDAIRESRMIFRRMNSYAIYRIAETVRVLVFLTLAIVLFNIYPLTVLMLVFLALINDIPIMMIAYDNARAHEYPTRWNMRAVLDEASLLGGVGVASSFGLLVIGIYGFNLSPITMLPVLESFVFLKMAVAGHFTIYLTRTGKKHFWSRPFPSGRLFWTAEGTKVLATVMVVYGILLPALPLWMALFVWGYSLAFFMIMDFVKVWFLNYRDRRDARISAAAAEAHAAA